MVEFLEATRRECKFKRTRRAAGVEGSLLLALAVSLSVSAHAQVETPDEAAAATAGDTTPQASDAASEASDTAGDASDTSKAVARENGDEPKEEAPTPAAATSPPRPSDESSGDVLISSGDSGTPPKNAQLTDSSVLTKVRTPGEEQRRKKEKPATRWSEVGAIVGMTSRPSSDDRFRYRPGIAYGGFFRPQITDYLGIGLSYREERISVEAAPDAFDFDGSTESLALEQSPLKVTSLGVRIEPTYPLTRFLHLQGVFSWSWVRIVYPMPHGPDFQQRADRAGVELNWGLGGGISVDLLHNWVNLGLMGAYHFVSNQTGSAYEPIQAVVDGQITHFAPMARPKHLVDVLLSLGIIL